MTITTENINRLVRITREAADALEAIGQQQAITEDVITRAFRVGSKRAKIARVLLDVPGTWLAKSALAKSVDTPPAEVPKAVSQLRGAGVEVERMTYKGEAFYRVVNR